MGKAQAEKGWRFTWREDEIRPEGRKKTFDVIMLEGDNYRKLVLIDDQPLDAKAQKQVDQDLEKTRAERRKRGLFHKTIESGGLADMLRLCDLKLSGEDTLDGRKAWRVEAEPKAGLKGANKKDEQVLSSHRVIWFDEEEGFDVKGSIVTFRAADGVQPGNRTESEAKKVGDAWLPASLTWHYDVKMPAWIHLRGDVVNRYYDYKRFQVESTFTPN